MLLAEFPDRVRRPLDKTIANRSLQTGGEIGQVLFGKRTGVTARHHGFAQRGLEAGEGEIAAGSALEGSGQGKARGVAIGGHALDGGTAGKSQTQQLRALVEALARRVVNGSAEASVAPDAFHDQQLTMPSGDQEQKKRERHGVREPRGKGMALEVIDGDERQVAGERHGFREHHAHHDAADETGTAGRGDAIEIVPTNAGFRQRAVHEPVEMCEMGARRHFGHDTAEAFVLGQLGQH